LQNIVEISNLFYYRGDTNIFDGLSLNIPVGKITAIMGPSGTGKTTLLKLIGGQLKPDSGIIRYKSNNIHGISQKKLYELRLEMGMLFQSGALLTNLSVFENVAFPLREHTKLNNNMIKDLVLMKLEAVGLRGAANLHPAELSGGMARRVALARAVILDPCFIMYDEPFTGQDPISMGVLVKLIKEMNDGLNLTSVLVSHDIVETCSIADYICIISKGKLIEAGTKEELYASTNPWTKQFMQGLSDGPVPFHMEADKFKDEIMNKRDL